MSLQKFKLPKRCEGSTSCVWTEFGDLAAKYNPVGLGSGFSDNPVPKYMTESLVVASNGSNYMLNQYTRVSGHTRLVNALSTLYSRLIGRQISALTEVLVTVGAYEALYDTILGHVDDGDEVIIIEPFFDCYEPMVQMAGGVAKYIPLRLENPDKDVISSGDFVLNDTELENLFNDKTKMIILNTPNNPLGKVFSRNELTKIAELCKKYNVLCVADEVYEWMIFDDNEHIRISSLPGMWERTITIGSAGKTFSVTGWKTDWAIGPAELLSNLQIIHQTVVCACPTPLQEAVASIFEMEIDRFDSPECYCKVLPKELQVKRDIMVEFLSSVGMKVIIPQGGCFLMVDWSNLENKIDLSNEQDPEKDYRFAKWLVKNVGVMGIPPSVFCSKANKKLMGNYLRFCFFKKDETLQKAAHRLRQWTLK